MSNYLRFYNSSYKYVFITVVTYNRIPLLIDNIEILRSAFKYAMKKYSFQIYAISVLKDHLHLILKLDNNNEYSEILRLIKYYFSIHINGNWWVYTNGGHAAALPTLQLTKSKIRKREKGVWQRRFWEHTIRDEKDLNIHLDYIHYNSYKHYQIPPNQWQYSSFKKFVKIGFYDENWCNCNDKNKINDLNFE